MPIDSLVETPIEPTDDELLTYLEGVNQRMEALWEAGFAVDPDQMETQLGLDAEFLQQSVDAVLEQAERQATEHLGLNEIVDAASRELLMATSFPMVVKTSMHPDLPAVPHPSDLLIALVLRALQIAAENAGPDRELSISTALTDGRVSVVIETPTPRPPMDAPSTMPLDVRSVSLTEMVQRIGGDVSLDRQEDLVRLTLEFAAETSSI